jgi:hypothetical protein
MVWLQSGFSTLGAYGYLLSLTVIISISSLFTLIPTIKGNYERFLFLILTLSITSIFFPLAMLNPTYTGAAIFSGSVGFGIIIYVLRSRKDKSLDLLVLSGFLISISYLMRVESFLLTFGFFVILFVLEALVFRSKVLKFSDLKIPMLIFFIIFSVNFIIEKTNYSSEAWKQYIEINNLRHSIQLRTAEYVLANHLDEVTWSQYDYELFRKFSLADPNKLNTNILESAVSQTSYTQGIGAILSSNFKNELIFINYSYSTHHWILFIIFIMSLLIFSSLKNYRYIFYSFSIFGLIFAINYFFATSYHLPDRLTFNLLFMLTIALLIYGFLSQTKPVITKSNYVVFINTVSIAFFFLLIVQIMPVKIAERIDFNLKRIELYENQKKSSVSINQVLIGTGSRFIYQGQSPYKKFENVSKSDNFIYLGWHNLSPIWSKQVSYRGLNPEEFHQEIIKNDDLFWIDDEGAIAGLVNFHQQYTTEEVIIEDTGYLGSEFYRILKISTQK